MACDGKICIPHIRTTTEDERSWLRNWYPVVGLQAPACPSWAVIATYTTGFQHRFYKVWLWQLVGLQLFYNYNSHHAMRSCNYMLSITGIIKPVMSGIRFFLFLNTDLMLISFFMAVTVRESMGSIRIRYFLFHSCRALLVMALMWTEL